VENMQASLRFYVDLLGFCKADWGGDDFTGISREGAYMYLCRGGQGRGGAWCGSGWKMRASFTGSWLRAAWRSACR